MSQHLIHVCVTDAPAWSQREGGKSKRTQKSNQTGSGRGKEGDGGKRQHNGANEKEEREEKADKKTEIRLIRFLRKTKPKQGGR